MFDMDKSCSMVNKDTATLEHFRRFRVSERSVETAMGGTREMIDTDTLAGEESFSLGGYSLCRLGGFTGKGAPLLLAKLTRCALWWISLGS